MLSTVPTPRTPGSTPCVGDSYDNQTNIRANWKHVSPGKGGALREETRQKQGWGGGQADAWTPDLPPCTGTPGDALRHPPRHLLHLRDAPVMPQQSHAHMGVDWEAAWCQVPLTVEDRRPLLAQMAARAGAGGGGSHSCITWRLKSPADRREDRRQALNGDHVRTLPVRPQVPNTTNQHMQSWPQVYGDPAQTSRCVEDSYIYINSTETDTRSPRNREAPPPRVPRAVPAQPPRRSRVCYSCLCFGFRNQDRPSSYGVLAESALRAQSFRGSSRRPRAGPAPAGSFSGRSRAGLVRAVGRDSSQEAGGAAPEPGVQALCKGCSAHSQAPDLSPSPAAGPLSPPQEAPRAGPLDSPVSESAMLFLHESPSRRSGTQSQGSLPLVPNAREQVTVNGKLVYDRVSRSQQWAAGEGDGPRATLPRGQSRPALGHLCVQALGSPQPPHPPGPSKGCFAGWQGASTSTWLCDLRQPPRPFQ